MGDLYALNLRRANRLVGETLQGKWKLDELLGVGGMAAVYAATHRNGSRAAVKILHQGAEDDPNTRRRFQREGYVANKVGHPGVPRVLDDDVTDDGRAYLVMELLVGESLEARQERHRQLPEDEVMHVGYQALDVLAAAHEKGIIHRDIKPDNLFLTVDGQVKVLDFGIARLHESATRGTAATQIGDLMGTLEFMSPEQAQGQWDEVDARSDLWSLGATLFTMLTGRAVHQAQTVNEMLAVASSEAAKPLAEHFPAAHAKTCRAIDGALRFERDERFSSAREMQRAVEEAFTAVSGRSIDDPLSLSIGQDDAETVTKLFAMSPTQPAIPPPPTAPDGVNAMARPSDPGDEDATVPFRPGDSMRPPMASAPMREPEVSIPPSEVASPGGGQTWIKRALKEPGHAKEAMWLVRLGFAAVVIMMIGALVWVVAMTDDAPDPSARATSPTSASSTAVVQVTTEPDSDDSASEEAVESKEEPEDQTTAGAGGAADAGPAAPASAAPPAPVVTVDPAWPPGSPGTPKPQPEPQFLKPSPLGPPLEP